MESTRKRWLKKQAQTIVTVLVVCGLLLSVSGLRALAYFNLGTVSLALSDTSVSLVRGETKSVSAVPSPPSSDQTAGCGADYCPQTCGDKVCADKNGQCTCMGAGYSTYEASVSVSSSNGSVAQAEWANGVLKITALSPGSATITAQASLREFTPSAEKTIQVSVTKAGVSHTTGGSSTGGNSTGGGSTGGASTGGASTGGGSAGVGSSGSRSATTGSAGGTSTGSGSAGGSSTAVGSADGVSSSGSAPSVSSSPSAVSPAGGSSSDVMHTASGTVSLPDIIQLPDDNIAGKDELAKIEGQDKEAVFQRKDTSDNVLYSWTFQGTDVTAPADFDMGITFSGGQENEIQKLIHSTSVFYLNFAHHGSLPGKATVSIRVSNMFRDGQKLYFYYYDPDKQTVSLQRKGVEVVNGYAALPITHCSSYFLSATPVNLSGAFPLWAIVLLVLAVLAAGCLALFLIGCRYKKRGKKIPAVMRVLLRAVPAPRLSTHQQHVQPEVLRNEDAKDLF